MLDVIDPSAPAGAGRADVESVDAAERLRNTAPDRPQPPEVPPHWRSIGQVLAGRQRRQWQVEHICGTPRLVLELLEEIGRHHDIAADIDWRIERYAALDPEILRAVGGDRLPAIPLHR